MLDFFMGFIFGAILIPCIISIIYFNSKSYKSREQAEHRAYIISELWLMNLRFENPLEVVYSNIVANVEVNRFEVKGTNGDAIIFTVSINGQECAKSIKTWDGYNFQYAFYVEDKFDGDEVWSILAKTYNSFKSESKQTSQNVKQSVLRRDDE